jgi:hypothetical protein
VVRVCKSTEEIELLKKGDKVGRLPYKLYSYGLSGVYTPSELH